MTNTSATGGTLALTGQPAYDEALDAIFQGLLVSLTGLPGNLVRPRWQPTPAKVPPIDKNWAAIGVMDINPDAGPALIHNGSGNGSDTLQRHELIEVRASFYGPNSQGFANMTRDMLSIPQNMETVEAEGIFFIQVHDVQSVPELVNLQWQKRYDLPIEFRRMVQMTTPIENIVEGDFEINTDPASMGPISGNT